MAQETNQSQGPLLCTTGCGFYGNPRHNGMCSVCYKDFLQRQNSSGRVSPQVTSSAVSSIGESLLPQCSDSSTGPVPTATSHTDTASGHSSSATAVSAGLSGEERTSAGLSGEESTSAGQSGEESTSAGQSGEESTSAGLSGEERTSGGKASLKTEDLHNEEQSSAARSEPCSASQDRQAGRSTSQEERRNKRKRKLNNTVDEEQASVSVSATQAAVESEDKPKAKKNRCFTCRKKVGLTGFDCRCGNVFCSIHRYSDLHGCTFDYKADAAEKIRKENPVIVGEKIQKI